MSSNTAASLARTSCLPTTFSCSCRHDGHDAAWISVSGELDIATAPLLLDALREPRAAELLVIVDLDELTFIDSHGLQVLAEATASARDAGRRLTVLRASAFVRRVSVLAGACGDIEFLGLTEAPAASPYATRADTVA